MKKFVFGLTPFVLAGSAFAEGEAVTIGADAQTVANAVTTWAQSLTPVVLPLVGAFLGFWAVKIGIRIVKGISSSAK